MTIRELMKLLRTVNQDCEIKVRCGDNEDYDIDEVLELRTIYPEDKSTDSEQIMLVIYN